jgi:hypothetical protein
VFFASCRHRLNIMHQCDVLAVVERQHVETVGRSRISDMASRTLPMMGHTAQSRIIVDKNDRILFTLWRRVCHGRGRGNLMEQLAPRYQSLKRHEANSWAPALTELLR